MRYALTALLLVALAPSAVMPATAQAQQGQSRLARCISQTLSSEGGRVATVVADPTLSVRSEPSLEATIMMLLPNGSPIIVLRQENVEWLQVIGVEATPGCVTKLGYVVSTYVR